MLWGTAIVKVNTVITVLLSFTSFVFQTFILLQINYRYWVNEALLLSAPRFVYAWVIKDMPILVHGIETRGGVVAEAHASAVVDDTY